MDKKPLPPGLHVVLGDHAAETFRDTFDSDDRLLVDQDVLSVGPTRPCESIAAWNAMRHGHWTRMLPILMQEHRPSPKNLLDHLERLRTAERVTIWCASSVSEQLFVAHVIHRAIEAGVDARRISIVQFETLPNRSARVLGIGELNAGQLAQHPEATPLSSEALRHYRAAWTALTADDPTLIEKFGDSHPDAPAALRHAMSCLLRRFPDRQSGITYWDRELLEDVRKHGPHGARVIGHALVKNFQDADLVGDWYLFGRMLRLGDTGLPARLLEMTGNTSQMRATEVRLTPFGADVLDGKAANYPVNPIDEDVAGVHLSSASGPLWFNDNGRLVREK
jgi:hypothetical protein